MQSLSIINKPEHGLWWKQYSVLMNNGHQLGPTDYSGVILSIIGISKPNICAIELSLAIK